MSFSDFFIRRPIGTCLMAAGLAAAGVAAFLLLPLAPLPQVEFPTILVQASLPGASAETMATSVATPLERSLTEAPGITEMTSANSLGLSQIALQFDLSRSVDAAAVDVQAAISAAAGLLPHNLPTPPTFHKMNPAETSILSLAITSDTLPMTELGSYADRIAQQLSQTPGVGFVDFNGEVKPALRVQVDPDKLSGLGLTLEDVRAAIGAQTVNAPKGSLSGSRQGTVLEANDQLTSPAGYQNLVIAYRNGAPIRLADVGRVVEGPEDVHVAASLDQKRTIIIDIHKAIGANVVATIAEAKRRLAQIQAGLPPAARLQVVGDHSQTIRASVRDVEFALMATVALVVMVIFLFLRNAAATVIPSITIPLALLATFGALYLLHCSLDNLSLMGLTIAVGFVVDDAIVVIENVVRRLDEGRPPLDAALVGVREVTPTVISMTASLVAVFLPIFLMGGLVGRLFREFALTVAIAVVTSGLVSLTLTPTLCAWWLRPSSEAPGGRLQQMSERFMTAALSVYSRTLDIVLKRQGLTLAVAAATLCLTIWLYVVSPKGFFPEVDTGLIMGVARGAPDISFDAMAERVKALGRTLAADRDVDNVYYWIGNHPTVSQGPVVINLKPLGERRDGAEQIMARLRSKAEAIEGVSLHMQIRQDLRIGARSSGTQYQYTLEDADVRELAHWSQILLARLSTLPQLSDVISDAQASGPVARLDLDRATASRLGITTQAIDDVLYDAFGQRQVATVYSQVDERYVIEEVDPRFQLSTDALGHLYVRSASTNALAPLSLLARADQGVSPTVINHQGLSPCITLSFNVAPGHSLGEAVAAIEKAAQQAGKPDTVRASFKGAAQEFQASLADQPKLILASVLAVYIILGVLYESAIHPLVIISSLPSAGLGALLALRLFGLDLSVVGVIGIIMLIGVVMKNAIMMVDFALAAQRTQALPPREAIREACLVRFRPILMTTSAAFFGALPLALGRGAGAELRTPLGVAVMGGLAVSQVLTLYTTPVIYLWLERLRGAIQQLWRGEAAAS